MKQYAGLYYEELMNNVVPFWENNSLDNDQGGFYSCLDRYGKVYDTDKFTWLQARQVWCFSMLYDKVAKNSKWLAIAAHGADFLKKYGRDDKGNWYFSLSKEGKPLIQPYNIFSDCFAAMGFAALHKIDPQQEYAEIARSTFNNILLRQDNPKGIYNKSFPGTRRLKNFALPMILCNLSLEMEHLIGSDLVNERIPGLIREVMEIFYDEEKGLILENVFEDGSFCDSFEGRTLNPGHVIEAMWFILDLATRINDSHLAERACKIMLDTLEFGWDKKYGGIFYFMDIKGAPSLHLEWDQKLWWVHAEALVGLAKAYSLTGDVKFRNWFEKVHEYTWNHFRDEENMEWYGYLNRRGEVLINAKGGKWKGCFHIPRALFQVYNTLDKPAGIMIASKTFNTLNTI